MKKTKRIQKQLEGLLTTQDLCRKYNVTAMTINHWRRRGMPAVVIDGSERDTVRFVPEETCRWIGMNRKMPVLQKTG
jgi:hypothetical protein